MTMNQNSRIDLTVVKYTACATFLYAICAGFRDNYGIMLPYLVEWIDQKNRIGVIAEIKKPLCFIP